jgi:hypothetical protein
VTHEPVVLEPHAGVGFPVIPRYVGRSSKMGGEPRISDALAKGSWTPLVWQLAAVTIILDVVALPASSVAVVVRAVVAMVVDAPSPSAGLNGVPRVTIRPEPALDCQHRSPTPFCAVLMPRGRRVRAVCGWCSCSSMLRPLA